MPRADARAITAQAIGKLATAAHRDVLNAGREVVRASSPRWRRVTDGAPCGFCAMLASRGPVYSSREKAGVGGNRYHGRCGCTAEPFEGDPADWVPTDAERRYIDAYEASYESGLDPAALAARIEAWMADPANGLAERVARPLIASASDAMGAVNLDAYAAALPGARNNCTNCAAAFEMILRDGVKREAVRRDVGRTLDEWLPAWRRRDGKPLTARSWSRVMLHSVQQMESDLLKVLAADGQRGFLRIKWSGNAHHVCNVVRENGAIVVYDAQSGVSHPLRYYYTNAAELRVLRSDELEFIGDAAEFFTTGG